MMVIAHCFCPTYSAIKLIAQEETIQDVRDRYTTDFGGNYLVPKSFFVGHWLTWIRSPCEYWGLVTPDGGFLLLIQRICYVMDQIRDVLRDPTSVNNSLGLSYLVSCYVSPMEKILRKTLSIIRPSETLPTFDVALRTLAPTVLEEVVAMEAPIHALGKIIHPEVTRSLYENHQIERWIAHVNTFGMMVSQDLLFYFFEYISYKEFPNVTDDLRFYYPFKIAATVHEMGLKAVVDRKTLRSLSESSLPAERLEELDVCFGERIPMGFPFDFPVTAYEIKDDAQQILMHSVAPLAIGMWLYESCRHKTYVPLLRVTKVDKKARFCIAEKIRFWLDDPGMWEILRQNKDVECLFVKQVTSLVQTMVKGNSTFDMQKEPFFFSISNQIGALRPIPELYSFFDPKYVEKWVRKVCGSIPSAMAFVLQASCFFDQPAVSLVQKLFFDHGFQANDVCVRSAISSVFEEERAIQEVVDMHRKVHKKMRYILPKVQKMPRFAKSTPEDVLHALARTYCLLQRNEGFFMHIPENLSELMFKSLSPDF